MPPCNPCPTERGAAALLLLALLALGCAETPVPPEQVVPRLRELSAPNVVLLVVDTLRADWLTPYGADEPTSPELARWASRGVLFERVRSQSSWTKTSMASLMTGLWPQTSGVRLRRDGLGEGAVTLAELFREGGYATYGVQSNGWLEQTFGFQQGFDRYMFPRGGKAPGMRTSVWPHADNVLREAIRLLDGHEEQRPFFLYLHFMDVHEYAAPPEFHTFGSGQQGAYRAAISWVDHTVERVRKDLDRRGLLDRTVIVLGADHGETFGENQRHGHAKNVFTPVLHVPLLIRFPFLTTGVRVSTQVRNVDLAPTLLDLAGLAPAPTMQGSSLLPLIASPEPDRPAFASLDETLFPDAWKQQALNEGRWSYARNAGEEDEREFLFDRQVDPREDVNLVGIEQAEAARLRERLLAHLASPVQESVAERDVRIDPSLAEKLRALGYAPSDAEDEGT